MGLIVITPPVVEPMTPTEAKEKLKIDGSDDDGTITSMIKQAREYCEDYQGKKFVTQTLELVLDAFPCGDIEFKSCSPIQSVTSIKYTDCLGVEYTFASSNYIVDTDSFVNRIVLAYNKIWPTDTLQPVNAVRIRFVAGYGAAAAVPETVKWAMALHMKVLYDNYTPDEQRRLEQARNSLLGMGRVIPV